MNPYFSSNNPLFSSSLRPQQNGPPEYGPLELGGSTYQYFIVDVNRITIATIGPDGTPVPSPNSPPIMMPIAGPFVTFNEANHFANKFLHGNMIVVLLPVHTFGRSR